MAADEIDQLGIAVGEKAPPYGNMVGYENVGFAELSEHGDHGVARLRVVAADQAIIFSFTEKGRVVLRRPRFMNSSAGTNIRRSISTSGHSAELCGEDASELDR
jgi:hypothetical protein